jgi:putative phage-type endonuclease
MNREDWLNERKRGIGGSDAAAILGLSPFKSALQVFLEKTGQLEDKKNDAERLYWGLQLEEKIAQEYSKRNKEWDVKYNCTNELIISNTYEWHICTVDALASNLINGYPNKVIECKNINEYQAHEWDNKVPNHYLIQLMHNISVTGLPYGVLCVLIGGQKWIAYEFERDEELIEMIVEREKNFWENHVLKNIPPNPTGASVDILNRVYRRANGTELTIDDNGIGDSIKAYSVAHKAKKEYEEQENANKALIQSHMGLAAKAIYLDKSDNTAYAISWANVKGSTKFDEKRFAQDHPELHQKYLYETEGHRIFRVTTKSIDKIKLLGGSNE